jgi:hypothetical protein
MGKYVSNTEQSYEEIKLITDGYYSGKVSDRDTFRLVHRVLLNHIGSLRRVDGSNPAMTISIPKSLVGIVVGVRYIKKSGRNTEDHFLYRPNVNLYKCKGKELAKICPEYTGAHELQIQTITQ